MPSTLPGNGAVGSSVDGGRIGSASSSASSRDDRSPKQINKHQHQQQQQHTSSTPTNIAESPSSASQSHTNGASSAAAAAAAVVSAANTPLAVNLKLNAAISAATSPLIENGNGAGAANPNVFLPEKFLPSTAASPSDLRKEYDVTKVNGKHRSTNSFSFIYWTLCVRRQIRLKHLFRCCELHFGQMRICYIFADRSFIVDIIFRKAKMQHANYYLVIN